MNKTNIIAVSGKGGVGKTSISALTVTMLTREKPDKKVLAIDADPAIGLATSLGVEVETTLDDIRIQFIDKLEGGGLTKQAAEVINDLRYELYNAIVEKDGFAFLAIGRPESSGCYCKINSFLKDIINLLAEDFDYVVIDGEAGIEQVNRRVVDDVTHLLLVSDTSKKGTGVIQTVYNVARTLGMNPEKGAIINRVTDKSMTEFLDTGEIEILECIDEDKNLGILDAKGETLRNLEETSAVYVGLKKSLKKLGVL